MGGIAHLTGRIPQLSQGDPSWSKPAPHPDVLCALTAGLPTEIASGLQKTLSLTFEMEDNPTLPTMLLNTLERLRPQILDFAFGKRIEAGEDVSQGEQAQYFMELQAQLFDNLDKIRNGETPDGFEQRQEQTKQDGELEVGTLDALGRKYCAQYFSYDKQGTYNSQAISFYLTCQKVIEQGGTLSISIPHCVNIIDTQAWGGKLFVLMRDPFNIYNTEYTRQEDGTETAVSEGLYEVWSKRRENRFLVGATQEEILRGGFRGTSWIELNELFPQISACWDVTPDLLRQ